MKRVLCLDVGDRSIGVAVSDSSRTIAQGICSIKFLSSSIQEKVNRIKELVLSKEAGIIVVGMPLDLKGREGRQAEKVREFAKLLEKSVNIPVIFADERFTSLAAERFLKEGGLSIQKRKKLKDKVAATILLQNYLDLLKKDKVKKE
ncbi:Holliday junction resolvase RuvX [Candidatus Aerophobetes bacterium]|nr:Holliday junction resolvase RuvX [Candidatus Aerophobetes bacterium]